MDVKSIIEKNNEIRKKMLSRIEAFNVLTFRSHGMGYLDTFTKNNELERVANIMYLDSMAFNDFSNKERHVGERYITKGIDSFYSNNFNISKQISYTISALKDNIYNEEKNIHSNYFGINDKIHYVGVIDNTNLTGFKHNTYRNFDDIKDIDISYLKDMFSTYSDSMPYSPEEGKRYIDKFNIYSTEVIDNLSNIENTFYENLDDFTSYENEEKDINEHYRVRERISEKNILEKTNNLFKQGKNKTLSTLSTYKGRDEKKLYKRRWSNQEGKKYDTLGQSMRPFTTEDGSIESMEELQDKFSKFRANNTVDANGNKIAETVSNGGQYLAENTVLSNNGLVNIAPSKNNNVDIKKCMFSIENLAWKDVIDKEYYLSKEQRGPNGGRIMWFPPYDLHFSESLSAEWQPTNFIGRGEPIYTYTNTERTGQLSFTLLIDHPNVLNIINKDINTEEDILNFFSGVDTLNFDNNIVEDNSDKKEDGRKEDVEVLNKECRTIKFDVFFPNRYSGVSKALSKSEWETDKIVCDDDWLFYLLIGRGNEISYWKGEEITIENWRGYEMRADSDYGIDGNLTEEDIKNQKLPAFYVQTGKCGQWNTNRSEVVYAEENDFYWHWADFDMRGVEDNISNYRNDISNRLNSQGYMLPNGFNEKFAFAEVAVALLLSNQDKYPEEQKNTIEHIKDYIIGQGCSSQNIDNLVYLFGQITSGETSNNANVLSVKVESHAISDEGKVRYSSCPTEGAELIAKRRAKTVLDFLKNSLNVNNDKIFSSFEIEDSEDDADSLEAKRKRCVSVEICIESNSLTNINDTAIGFNEIDGEINISDNMGNKENDENADSGDSQSSSYLNIPSTGYTRYETEAEYFIKASKDIKIKNGITEKLKYFNPAFHSISPEGFNARLTFLQQCVRQGHTMGRSDGNLNWAAGNLAFGRMPVCVLRIGDFWNTRILIDSINISYDEEGISWDMNPEGIGMQPMFAKVDLGIKILGGQSLNGPISRLQNAVSFNYYANTGVYDNRSDRIEYGTSDNKYESNYSFIWNPYNTLNDSENRKDNSFKS